MEPEEAVHPHEALLHSVPSGHLVKHPTPSERHTITAHDHYRLLLIDGSPVRFTPLEYRLVRLLLECSGTPIHFDGLAHAAFGRDADLSTRRALEKHVDRIRSKLRPFGLAVPYVTNYGYVLLHDDP
jgi:DNA-binding response OmpR family regulator